jgi:hypothetical protein
MSKKNMKNIASSFFVFWWSERENQNSPLQVQYSTVNEKREIEKHHMQCDTSE